MNIHASDQQIVYRCHKCMQTFTSFRYLNLHYTAHSDKQPEFKCAMCKLPFENLRLLSKHYMFHGKRYSIQCFHCIRQFTDISIFNDHNHVHVSAGLLSYCMDCGRLSGGLESSHNHVSYRPIYTCDICNITTDQEKGLLYHRQVMHAGQHYRCKHCQLGFQTPRELKLHMNNHPQYAPFICEFCGEDFVDRQDQYDDHVVLHLSMSLTFNKN